MKTICKQAKLHCSIADADWAPFLYKSACVRVCVFQETREAVLSSFFNLCFRAVLITFKITFLFSPTSQQTQDEHNISYKMAYELSENSDHPVH